MVITMSTLMVLRRVAVLPDFAGNWYAIRPVKGVQAGVWSGCTGARCNCQRVVSCPSCGTQSISPDSDSIRFRRLLSPNPARHWSGGAPFMTDEQMREGVKAIHDEVDIHVAASLGMLSQEQVDDLVDMGVHRYNHNLEAARSYFPEVVTTHTYEERWDTCRMVKESGMELCCGGLVGMGETLEQRAELAAELSALEPHEVPLNFLNPRPGTPFGHLEPMSSNDALRTIAAFRLALPRTILRYAGGRELTLGDLGTKDGLLGGINAVIVGNYLTTLGRDPKEDLALLEELEMPIKALNETL